jgi:hypothetical protein
VGGGVAPCRVACRTVAAWAHSGRTAAGERARGASGAVPPARAAVRSAAQPARPPRARCDCVNARGADWLASTDRNQ